MRDILRERLKLSYITPINIGLVNQISAFLKPVTKMFDKLEGVLTFFQLDCWVQGQGSFGSTKVTQFHLWIRCSLESSLGTQFLTGTDLSSDVDGTYSQNSAVQPTQSAAQNSNLEGDLVLCQDSAKKLSRQTSIQTIITCMVFTELRARTAGVNEKFRQQNLIINLSQSSNSPLVFATC